MVSDDLVIVIHLVNLFHSFNTLSIANNHQYFVDALAKSVELCTLLINLESEVFRVFGAVHLYKGGVVASIEAGMVAVAEAVQLVYDVVEINAKGSEDDRKLFLLFFKVHQSSEETWNNVVAAFAKNSVSHFFLIGLLCAGSDGFFVIRVLVFGRGLHCEWPHAFLTNDAELFFGSLRKGQAFDEFFILVLEL